MRDIPFLRFKFAKFLPLIILLLFYGCTKSSFDISINKSNVVVEIANTPQIRESGLMYRVSLKNGHGMLFIYPKSERLSFWMKNTLIPLSIAFIDEQNRIISIQHMIPQSSPPYTYYASPLPAKYALEVPQGWFEKEGISAGDIVKFPKSLEKAIKKAE